MIRSDGEGMRLLPVWIVADLCVEQPISELARESLSLISRADGITDDACILDGPSAKVWSSNR